MNPANKIVWLVQTISDAKRISLKEIQKKYKESVYYTGTELSRSSFNRWKAEAEELMMIEIGCDNKGGYKYYIKEDLKDKSDIRNWVFNNTLLSNIFINNIGIKDKIITEEIPEGNEYLQTIIDAISNKQVLRITHKGYTSKYERTTDCMPLCIRLCKQRWYVLFQYIDKNGELRKNIYALDRIISIEQLEGEHFEEPKDFNAKTYFKHLYGAFINGADKEPETIRIKTTKEQMTLLLRSLPLHHTQKEVETMEDGCAIFEYRVHPNLDFRIAILGNGADLEVLSPDTLRTQLKNDIQKLANLYKVTE